MDINNSILVKTENLFKIFPVGQQKLIALNQINITFKKREFAGSVGPSGSGKMTLLNVIGTLDVPAKGSAIVMGQRVDHLSHRKAAELRNHHIGFILQTIARLHKELNTTFIFATHDEKVIQYLQRKIFPVDGRVDSDEILTA